MRPVKDERTWRYFLLRFFSSGSSGLVDLLAFTPLGREKCLLNSVCIFEVDIILFVELLVQPQMTQLLPNQEENCVRFFRA
jgi:hypothetical protein